MNLEELKWHKFPVGSDGFICLVDVMGDDSSVVQAARVSYGKGVKPCKVCGGKGYLDKPDPNVTVIAGFYAPDAPCEACKKTGIDQDDSRRLIRYLMRHRHTTPFEMSELKFLVRVPMDTWRQWIRQRTASVNEYSTRYSKAIDSMAITDPGEWRLQSADNKQGSAEYLREWPEGYEYDDGFTSTPFKDRWPEPGSYLSMREQQLLELAESVYKQRLEIGVAREQARKDLPLSTLTEAYWKIDLHNLLNFLSQRMDPHAQKEIRDYATTIGNEIVRPLFPLVWEAFEDYRLGAVTLSRLDVEMLKECLKQPRYLQYKGSFKNFCKYEPFFSNGWDKERCRERDEFEMKLERMGFVF